MKSHGYLQDKQVRGKTYSYGNFSGERPEPLTPAELDERLDELEYALTTFEQEAPELKTDIQIFKMVLENN